GSSSGSAGVVPGRPQYPAEGTLVSEPPPDTRSTPVTCFFKAYDLSRRFHPRAGFFLVRWRGLEPPHSEPDIVRMAPARARPELRQRRPEPAAVPGSGEGIAFRRAG